MAKKPLEKVIIDLEKKCGDDCDFSLVNKDNYIDTHHLITVICKHCGEAYKRTPHDLITKGGHLCKRLVCGVGDLDIDYAYNVDEITKKAYDHWGNMLMRCYSDAYQKRNPNYIGCTVDERWHKFSVFLEWFKENYIDGYALDKDLLIPSNKCYSPETCCFLPPKLNTMIVTRHRKTNRFGKGVSITPKGRYIAFLNRYNKTYNLGHFDTIEEAFNAYKQGKIAYVREVADSYYKDGKITKEVYDALYRYEPKFKD